MNARRTLMLLVPGSWLAAAFAACGGGDPTPAIDVGSDAARSPAPEGGNLPRPADGSIDAGDAAVGLDAALEPPCARSTVDAGRSDECLARLDLVGKKLPYYRSHALDSPHPAIERLVVIQHGSNRNAWDHYDVVSAAARVRDPARTAVVAPLFQAYNTVCGQDAKEPDDLYWGCSDWKEGREAKNAATDSFVALDALIVAAKAAFPGLKRVTVAGYSAGGQTVQRYAAGNLEHDRTPSIATRYVVSSPGSYMYLDGRRVHPSATCTGAASCTLDPGSFVVPTYAPDGCVTTDGALDPDDPDDAYDDYRYGLRNRKGYLAGVADAHIVAKYPARSVVYVLSDGDSRSGAGTAYSVLDRGCPAMVQAPVDASFRLQRGLVFHRYMTLLFGASHRMVVVPVCAHDEACVLSAPATQEEIFGP